MHFALAIHGGAGLIQRNLSDEDEEAYLQALRHTLEVGVQLLQRGVQALDVVQATIEMMEDESIFNAGRGSVLNSGGFAECDAALMDGSTRAYGAVAASRRLKNPVAGARYVMDKTLHVLLCGEGADSLPLPTEERTYFVTPLRQAQLEAAQVAKRVILDHEATGTVGAVALDVHGHLAAGSSTGGMTNKMVGRIGDTPIVGAGLYADDRTCAVSCTGRGEKFLGSLLAHRISNQMEFGGLSLRQAVDESFANLLEEGDGGLLAVDREGNLLMPFNTAGMFRGAADSNGRFELGIWE